MSNKGKTQMKTAAKVITSGRVPRGKGSGAVGMGHATVKMKTLLASEGGGTAMDHAGAIGKVQKLATLQTLEATDREFAPGSSEAIAQEVEKQIIADAADGRSPVQIAKEYGVHRNFVQNALARRFGSTERGKEALLGLTLENALALQELAASKIHEFSGPQAVMSSAILTDKVIALQKSISETPKTIDFGALKQIGQSLQRLNAIVPQAAGAQK